MTQTTIFRTFCGIIILLIASFAALIPTAESKNALDEAEFIVLKSDDEAEVAVRADDLFQGNQDIYNARTWVRVTFFDGDTPIMYAREKINCVAKTTVREFLIIVQHDGTESTVTSSKIDPILPDSNLDNIASYVCMTPQEYLDSTEATDSSWEA